MRYADPSGHWCTEKQNVYEKLVKAQGLDLNTIDPDTKLRLMAEASNIVRGKNGANTVADNVVLEMLGPILGEKNRLPGPVAESVEAQSRNKGESETQSRVQKPYSGTEVAKLLDKMPELSGNNRGKLLSVIQNEQLYKITNELYRPTATIGDGGTAAKLMQEYDSGLSTHLQKATERLKNLNNLIRSENLGLNDLDIAEALRDDLETAVDIFK